MRKKTSSETTSSENQSSFLSKYSQLYTPALVVLLIVASFLVGMLYTKVQYLEDSPSQTAQQTAPSQQTAAPVLGEQAPAKKVDIQIGDAPVLGDKNAKVTIIEFSDFQCPFCKQFFDASITQLKEEYVKAGKVKLAYKHYPLSFHANAQGAAEASECANEQNKFWEYHDLLFTNQKEWENQDVATATTTFNTYAGNLGLDTAQFSTCLSTNKYKEKVDKDTALGTQVGVSGTPSTFVNGTIIVGAQPYASFKALIDAELAK